MSTIERRLAPYVGRETLIYGAALLNAELLLVLGYLAVQQFIEIRSVFVEGTIGLIIATVVMLGVCAVTEQEETVAQFSEQHRDSAAGGAPSAQPADDD